VLNLDETIAVTQNFVDVANLRNVVEYLAYSDCALHDRFLSAIEHQRPDLLAYTKPVRSDWDAMLDDGHTRGDGADFKLSF